MKTAQQLEQELMLEAQSSDFWAGSSDCDNGLAARTNMSNEYYDGYGRAYELGEIASHQSGGDK